MKSGWQAPLAALAVIILFAAFAARPIGSAADIAGWVQGVGSLLAVVAAVIIYARQYGEKKADDEASVRAYVQSISDEVQAAWAGYSIEIHPALVALPNGQPFDQIYPVTVEPFPVYNGTVAMVGKVDDPELRRAIISTYALARGLLDSFRLNNGLLTDFKQLNLLYHQPNRAGVLQAHQDGLVQYAGKLKERDIWVKAAVENLLARAEQWLASHPAR
jgi:hypothetical protein